MKLLAYFTTLFIVLTSACNNNKSIKQEAQLPAPPIQDKRAKMLDSTTMPPQPVLIEEPFDSVCVWEEGALTAMYLVNNTNMVQVFIGTRPPEYYESKTYGEFFFEDERNSIKIFEQICRSVFSEERANSLYNCEISCTQYYGIYEKKYLGMGRIKVWDGCDTSNGFPVTADEFRTLEKEIAAHQDELFNFYHSESIVEGFSDISFRIKFRNLYK